MNPYVILIGASFIAGTLNAMAGGGSFFSFPALLAVGVPPVNANATNTVALWPGANRFHLRFPFRIEARHHVDRHRNLFARFLGGIAGALALYSVPIRPPFLSWFRGCCCSPLPCFALSDPAHEIFAP